MTRHLALALAAGLAGCASPPTRPSPPAAPTDAAPTATARADCERVLAHTWHLIGGDPASDKRHGARHEREVGECMAHITPAARDCVLAARADAELAPCEALAR